MNVWKVSWLGLCDQQAVEATLSELGGWFENGNWYFPQKFKYPTYLCWRLSSCFKGVGEYRITLTAA